MNGAFATLVRHFVGASLAPDVLTEVGRDYLRRVGFGVLAIFLVLGSFLPRVFFHKYTELGAVVGTDAYQRALQADTLMMLAVPMLLIALVTVVAGPLLFPDETDYRVLTPLPISRAFLFGAKLVSVVALVAAAVWAVNAVATFWFPIAVGSRKAGHPLVQRVIAHAIASTAASVFSCLAVMALQGVIIAAVPWSWQRRASVIAQALIVVGLLLSVPIVTRLSGMDVRESTVMTTSLLWMPPAWFLGMERWLLDGSAAGGYVAAARLAAIASAAVGAVVIVSYAVLYRSAERLAGVAGADRATISRPGALARMAAARLTPPTFAIVDFIRAGVARSRLHQFVFVIALGGGVAILIGRVMTAMEGLTPRGSQPSAVVQAALSAPLIAGLTFVLGLRAAYKWPLDLGASWLFRVTDDPRTRPAMLNGTALCLSAGALVIALVTAAVLQPRIIGPSWIAASALTSLVMLILVESLMIEWRRVPFACTYLPGTRPLAYHLGVIAAQFFTVVVIGGSLIRFAIGTPARTAALAGFLLAAWAALRRERWKTWGLLPIEFEDADPAEVQVLKL